MWSREILKNEAKATLQTCHGYSIAVCLILAFFGGVSGSVSFRTNFTFYDEDMSSLAQIPPYLISAFLGMMGMAMVISILLRVFLGNILSIGGMHFFLSARVRPASIDAIGFGFKKGSYWNICKTMFLMHLFISLWSLLFVIPGIYKSYQYRMVPYILAENPDMDYHRALSLSAAMMEGEKMNAFVLDLSFIGWYFLSIFTCYILLILYVLPYQLHTNAGLYILLREKAINNGLADPAELYAVVG